MRLSSKVLMLNDGFLHHSISNAVGGNRRGVEKILSIAENKFGIRQILPDMGPHKLEDKWKMALAMVMLECSFDEGINDDTVQFDIVRQLRSAYGSVWGSSKHALSLGVMAKDTMKIFVTQNPGYTLWFERFVKGCHNRMGDNKRQDMVIMRKIMVTIIARVEVDFHTMVNYEGNRFLVRAGFIFLVCYL